MPLLLVPFYCAYSNSYSRPENQRFAIGYMYCVVMNSKMPVFYVVFHFIQEVELLMTMGDRALFKYNICAEACVEAKRDPFSCCTIYNMHNKHVHIRLCVLYYNFLYSFKYA